MAYTYARRNELAREKGFANYAEYRRVVEYANQSRDFNYFVGTAGGTRNENLDMAKLFYQAFKQSDRDDYSIQLRRGRPVVRTVSGKPRGARAKWLIEIAQYVDDAQEWRTRYPNGHRGRE